LFGAAKESSECVDELVTDCTSAQVVSLVLHRGDLSPLVFSDVVLFDGTESLLAGEATKYEDRSFADSNSMSISALVHLCLVEDLIFQTQIDAGVFLWW